MSRWACRVSPHWGARWLKSSSLMAHRSFPLRSLKARPAWARRYRCSVHSSHFCTLAARQSMGSVGRSRTLGVGRSTDMAICRRPSSCVTRIDTFTYFYFSFTYFSFSFFIFFITCILCFIHEELNRRYRPKYRYFNS